MTGEQPSEIVGSSSGFWHLYFAVVALAVAAAVLGQAETPAGHRAVAVASIAGMAALYALWGRRGRAGPAYVIGTLLLFCAGAFADPAVSYLLFALCPLLFVVLDIRAAVVAVLCANVVPLLTGFLRTGGGWGYFSHNAPVFVASSAFALWFGIWIHRLIVQSSERAALIAELEASRAEVARLSHEAGVAAERARLAGEIHDTLAQGFTSIITLLQAVDPGLADERLALAVRTARENLAESRSLVAALAPAALSSGSLLDAVRRQTARFTEETAVAATCRVSGEVRPLPTAVEVVLLRAAQEALANVRRHAQAGQVSVLLAYGVDSVRLVVRDDGRGFDPAAAHGFGLPGMRARAEQVNGRLSVHSVPGAGALVEVEVPS
ncbi:sensor histidine kinase [Actinoplanes sp. NPDC026623]|uniref:sensor histidine kinase n=1 Tax=Actinoplanes sp. NPDC026623 TaxID=3155610 RepID=UPI0033C0F411